MNPVVETVALSVRVEAKTLLDSVALSVEAGETIALIGPNGAGKSTLLRALSGEIPSSAGHITLKGRDLREYSPRILALHRAVLSQHVTVAFPFTVLEVVGMGAGEQRGRAVDALVDEALAAVDLHGFHSRIINTLSGGEQQRVHFARVLVQLACGERTYGPGLLLLDEPTASLDLRHQLDILAAVRSCAARGVTVVVIMHDLNLAALAASRIVVLDNGRVATDGSPSQTITDDVLAEVFGVSSAVGQMQNGAPCVLPHNAQKVALDRGLGPKLSGLV